jgi:hypothetical protein
LPGCCIVVVDAPGAPQLARGQVLEHTAEHALLLADDGLHLVVAHSLGAWSSVVHRDHRSFNQVQHPNEQSPHG